MSKVLIGVNNTMEATTVFSGSFGSWASTLPLDNLKSYVLSKVARTTGVTLANTQFALQLSASYNVRVFALCNHNLSFAALVKITAYSDSSYTTLVHDSGWISAWPNAFSAGWNGWNDTTPDGTLPHTYTVDVNNARVSNRLFFNWNYTYIPTDKVEARWWKVEVDDTTNADGYVQVGRLFIGHAWEPDFNFDFGQSIAWETDTAIQYSKGGTPYFDVKKPTRCAKFTLSNLSQIEAMQTVFTIFGNHGIDKELFYIQDRDNIYDYQRSNFLGRLRQLSEIEHPTVSQYSSSFEIKESL